MVAPERREVDAVLLDDGWIACTCGYRVGYKITGTDEQSRVKCPGRHCGAWIRLAPRPRDRVSRVLTR